MKTKISAIGFAAVLLMSFVLVSNVPAAGVKHYVWGSGPMGGSWPIGVGAGAQLLNQKLKEKYAFTAAASGGSVENMRRMLGGEYDIIWVHVNNMWDAWNGRGLFDGQKPFKDIRVIEYLIDQCLNCATLAKYPIKNYKDLEGKKVNLGPAGSGVVPISKALLTALGLIDKVKIVNINFRHGAQAVKDRQIDATFAPGGPLVAPALNEIARSVKIRLVEPTPEEAKKVESKVSYLHLGVIPPNIAPGENADKKRKGFFWSLYWLALPRVPDEVVYDMLRVTQDPKNKKALGKILRHWSSAGPEFDSLVKMGIPLHAGSVRYWKEQGLKIPTELIPPEYKK